jgi:hypothetical protein
VYWCSSWGDALAFAHFGSSFHCIVFLATSETMCHLSLGVWTNILSVCLFVLFVVLLVFVCIYLFLSVYKIFYFLFIAMVLIGHNLYYNCGLHVIGVFNLFEHCISLEIPVFDSCVGLKRLHLFD